MAPTRLPEAEPAPPVSGLVYETHFGLSDKPFRLTPELALRVPEPSQEAALNMLELALAQGEGFIKVTGEVGLGKTLLCRTLLGRLDAPYVTAWLPDPLLSPGSLRSAIARELGLKLPQRASQHQVGQQLQKHLATLAANGRSPVVVIDEAQALPERTLEAVRLLTNLETERRKLLQVVLFGQPELDQRLARPALRQLAQRITFGCRLEPLESSAVGDYVNHRTRAAGARSELFTPDALALIANASRGVPRLINILCHKALLAAWGLGLSRAGPAEVRRAIEDTDSIPDRPRTWPRMLARAAGLGALVAVTWLLLHAVPDWVAG